MDCLQTKTIPIYYGCPNIGNWFNLDGFIIVDNLEDIITACNSLNENSYQEKMAAVEENFEKSKKYAIIIKYITIRPNVPYIKIPLHTNSCIGGMDDTNGRARSGLQGSLGEKRSA